MKLLIDLGNTRLKWASWNGKTLHPGGAIVHSGNESVDFAILCKDIQSVESVWVASVATLTLNDRLAKDLGRICDEPLHFVSSRAEACGVRNAYSQPARLGVDRFLAMIAAHAHAHEPTVLASCGTALTLDLLAENGVHVGGLIAPAPDLMRSALLGNTARLGELGDGHVGEFATNTADAVESGTWLAAVALIERFVAKASERLGSAPALLLSGGGAQRLGELIQRSHRIDAELVLRGLAQFADESH
jgi:type III pantothenate kinase